jgi:hypothetical protein
MSKAILKKAIKKAIQETGLYNKVKVWDVVIEEDYTGQKWLNIEVSANELKKRKQ